MKKMIIWALLAIAIECRAENYELERGSIYYDSGEIVDSRLPGVLFAGTMSIDGVNIVQNITISVFGRMASATARSTLLTIDNSGNIVTMRDANGFDSTIILLENGEKLVTFFNAAGSGFAEVDQWRLVREGRSAPAEDFPDYAPVGAVLGTLFN